MDRAEGRNGLSGTVRAELAEFEEQIRKYRAGELGEVKMQKLRLHYGTYAQRQEGVQMQRIKIPGGRLTARQLARLADAAERYGSGFMHLTTREDVQIYYLRLEETPDLLRFLDEEGITTREACGNTVRNITACYRAGTSPSEPFDVSPYALALFRYLVRNKYNQSLGRKFKITFEGCAEDHAGIRIHDIGFIARTRNERGTVRRGFRVYLGGGLGGNPMLGHLYSEFLPAEELFAFAAAVLRLFDRYGERKSRMKARMKFLVETMGWERFAERLDEERARVGHVPFAEGDLDESRPAPRAAEIPGQIPLFDPRAASPDFERWARDCVAPHKVAGLRGVHVRIKLGDLVADCARQLAGIIERYSAGEARTSPGQNLFLPWVRASELVDLYHALQQAGLADPGAETAADITTCPGSDTCRLGIASAKGLGATLSDALEGELARHRDRARDVKIKISGCPNGCAQHSIADIGFHAAAMTEGGRTVPTYLLFVGGRTRNDDAAIGALIGKYPARNGVRVLEKLLGLYEQESAPDEQFGACMERLGERRLRNELDALRHVPSFDEDPSFYQDYGHENERFAVRQGVKGECAGSTVAEVVPSIDDARARLAQGEAYFYHQEYGPAVLEAYEAAAAAARVPLYRKLVDPFTSEHALWEFENIFVLSGETQGAWADVSAELDGLREGTADEATARAILARARGLVSYCADLSREPAPEPANARLRAAGSAPDTADTRLRVAGPAELSAQAR